MALAKLHDLLTGKSAPGTGLYDRYQLTHGAMQAASVQLLTAEANPALHAAIAEAAQHMGTVLPRRVVLAESEQPLVRMLFNDTLAISSAAMEMHTPEELQARIAHSLVHQKDKWRDAMTVVGANLAAEAFIERIALRAPGLNSVRTYVPVEPWEMALSLGFHTLKTRSLTEGWEETNKHVNAEFSEKLTRALGEKAAQHDALLNDENKGFLGKLLGVAPQEKLAFGKYVLATLGAFMAVEELAGYVASEHSRTTYLQADYESVQRGLNATTLRQALEKVRLREEALVALKEQEEPGWRKALARATPEPVKAILKKREHLMDNRPEFAERIMLLRELERAQQTGQSLS